MPRLVVIGSSNTDLVITGERLPAPGETVSDGRFEKHAGGKGANQAVAAARAGAEVSFIGACGDDSFGEAGRAGLEREGIDCRHFHRVADCASGVALILIGGPDRQNLISVAPGANRRLTCPDVDDARAAIASADILLASLESPLESVERALQLARDAGVRTVLNPAPMPRGGLPDRLTAHCDVIVPNEIEAQGVGDGVAERVVTLGARGCRVGGRLIPAPEVQPVDTVGAGDCFCAWLAVGLGEGMGLEAAAERANRAAAIAVTRPGAQAGMPRRDEVPS